MAERTMFSEGDVVVTSSRVTIRGDNYFVNQISQSKVRYTEEKDAMKDFLRKAAIVGAVVVGIWIGISSQNMVVGLGVSIVGAIAALVLIRPDYKMYHLYLGMSSGDARAFSHVDSLVVNRINNAITEALSARA
jgi:hypothetical protein